MFIATPAKLVKSQLILYAFAATENIKGEYMRHLKMLVLIVAFAGCATGKMGRIEQPLAEGAISKTTPIYVETISAKNMTVTGDKANDSKRTTEEKQAIEAEYAQKIVEHLRAKGFNAQLATAPVKTGVTISGTVTKVEHGSAAARFFVGMGAGSANMFADFMITDRAKNTTMSKFQVIATSGGTSGLGSYLNRFLNDGGKKVAEYVEKGK